MVMERTLEISHQNDQMIETEIDLTDALDGDTGHLILLVEPESGLFSALFNRRLQEMRILSWVQVTGIGLDAFVDADEMVRLGKSPRRRCAVGRGQRNTLAPG